MRLPVRVKGPLTWPTLGLLALGGALAPGACSDYPQVNLTKYGGGSNLDGSGGDATGGSGAATGGTDIIVPVAGAGGEAGAGDDPCAGANPPSWCEPPECGDGRITGQELCDDGNSADGDGCSADCDVIENDYVCPTPGEPCVYTVECGDGVIAGAEQCDDANESSGDGCDASCEVETGWVCPGPGRACIAEACGDGILAGNEQCDDGNGSAGDGCSAECRREDGYVCETAGEACRETECNDGVKEGSEPCDDGNNVVGDGCNPWCEVEPSCDSTGCSSACGDGMMLATDNEACDDGNTVDGDGCSATCQIEEGYQCELTQTELPDVLEVPVTFRDFVAYPQANPDRHPDFQQYSGQGATLGLVEEQLGADGKPVYTGLCETGSSYTATECPYDDQTTSQADFDQWYRDTPGVNISLVTRLPFLRLSGNVYQYEDTSLYPFDDAGWVASGEEDAYDGHNYGFTSELRYWFEYNGGEQLDFSGDDDVWVFVNGHLAVDLGGLHSRTDDGVTLNSSNASQFGLQEGRIYEIVLFHAERHTAASNFILTLGGFVQARSECESICGDGIVAGNEVCDDGDLNGTYGHCSANCDGLGQYCGDGLLRVDQEECDNGVNLSTYQFTADDCAPGCVLPPYCGDANVDSEFGEVCDDGVNDGGYGECEAGCRRGARCGDNVVQESNGEECDDGNRRNGDGCNAECRLEQIT